MRHLLHRKLHRQACHVNRNHHLLLENLVKQELAASVTYAAPVDIPATTKKLPLGRD